MESIRENKQKFKQFRHSQDLAIVLIIVLVATASFGLGRLSRRSEQRDPTIYIGERELPSVTASVYASQATPHVDLSSTGVVVSKNGSKYHFPWCSGAKRIKEENKISFLSTQEAREAGYEPASNCKGLD